MVQNEGKCSLTLVFDSFADLIEWVKMEQKHNDHMVHGKGVKLVKRADVGSVDPKRRFMVADPLKGGQFVRLETQIDDLLVKADPDAPPETGEPVETPDGGAE